MPRRLPRILILGATAPPSPGLKALETAGRYLFEYLPDPPRVSAAGPAADAVLLPLPPEKASALEGLGWIETFKDRAPVVVLSAVADMNLYLSAMTAGAFDFLTQATAGEELTRVLDNAVRWRWRRAA